MEHGASFSAAEKATYHVFDTVGWHEITSRLRRARGFVHKWAPFLANSMNDVGKLASMTEARHLAMRIRVEACGLREVMKGDGYWFRSKTPSAAILKVTPPRGPGEPHSSQLILGKFKAALRFVAKSHRDAPQLIQKEIVPTVQVQATIAAEIRRLLASVSLLQKTRVSRYRQ